MKDAMISVNDLYKGMKLEKDIFNNMCGLLFPKGSVLSESDLIFLTSLCQSFLFYKDTEGGPGPEDFLLLDNINDYIRTVTFVESFGINLEERAAFYYPFKNSSDWMKTFVQGYAEHVLYKYFHENIPVTSQRGECITHADTAMAAGYTARVMYEAWEKRMVMPLDFYMRCLSWMDEYVPSLYRLVKQMLTPLPEGSSVILKDGEEYQVVHVTAEEPFRPVLRKKYGSMTVYFSDDIEYEIETVLPVIIPS